MVLFALHQRSYTRRVTCRRLRTDLLLIADADLTVFFLAATHGGNAFITTTTEPI